MTDTIGAAELGSRLASPSNCPTFRDLYDKATSAQEAATTAADAYQKALNNLSAAEAALTAAQAAVGAAVVNVNAPSYLAATAAVAAAAIARDNRKADCDAAERAQNRALVAQKEANSAMVSHRNSCAICLK